VGGAKETEREREAPAGVPLHRSINTNDVTALPRSYSAQNVHEHTLEAKHKAIPFLHSST
jgi:hypothetical protein